MDGKDEWTTFKPTATWGITCTQPTWFSEAMSPDEFTKVLQDMERLTMAKFPHCDPGVLHRPAACKFCDMYPDLQQERIKNNINFTNEKDPNKKQCPAEARRSNATINRWGGNIAQPDIAKDGCPKCNHRGDWINLALVCPVHGKFAG